jgi:hypothetical protein
MFILRNITTYYIGKSKHILSKSQYARLITLKLDRMFYKEKQLRSLMALSRHARGIRSVRPPGPFLDAGARLSQ